MGEWTFFSNHGHVLVCLARDREARLRDVAIQVGITERAVQKIVRDMQDEGYLEISKHGRRNRYRINTRKALRHPLQSGCTVGQLIQLLNKSTKAKADTSRQVKTETPAPLPPAPTARPELEEPALVEPVSVQIEPIHPEPEISGQEPAEPAQAEPESTETVSVEVVQSESELPEPVSVEAVQSEPALPEPVSVKSEQPEPDQPKSEPEKKNKKPAKSDLEQGQLF